MRYPAMSALVLTIDFGYSLQKLSESFSFLSLRKFTKLICAPTHERFWPLEKPHFWSAASSLWCRSHLFALTTCQKDWISAHWEQIWDPICQFAARVYSRCLYFAYISMLFYEISNSNSVSLVGAAKSECWNGKALPSQFIETPRCQCACHQQKSARRHRLKLGKSAITGGCHELCLCERWCFVTRMILKGDRSDRDVLNI